MIQGGGKGPCAPLQKLSPIAKNKKQKTFSTPAHCIHSSRWKKDLTTAWVSCTVAFFSSVRAAASSLASACCSGGIVLGKNDCKYYKTVTLERAITTYLIK